MAAISSTNSLENGLRGNIEKVMGKLRQRNALAIWMLLPMSSITSATLGAHLGGDAASGRLLGMGKTNRHAAVLRLGSPNWTNTELKKNAPHEIKALLFLSMICPMTEFFPFCDVYTSNWGHGQEKYYILNLCLATWIYFCYKTNILFLASKGQKVVLVDVDPQAYATMGLDLSWADLEKTMSDILCPSDNGNSAMADILLPVKENLWLAPSNRKAECSGAANRYFRQRRRRLLIQ